MPKFLLLLLPLNNPSRKTKLMLKVKKLHPDAQLPTVAHPGTDLGFDLYALEDTALPAGVPVKIISPLSSVKNFVAYSISSGIEKIMPPTRVRCT